MDDKHQEDSKREYYAQRTGRVGSLSFEQIKSLYGETITYLKNENYLMEATGHYLGDEINYGLWGHDIPAFILKHLRLENIWPFEKFLPRYDESTLFSVIEFIYDYVSKAILGIGKPKFRKRPAQEDYRKRVNEILELRTVLMTSIDGVTRKITYELSIDGEIREKVQEGFEKLLEEMPETSDPENIDEKIQYAKSRFLRYGATIEEKKDAIRTLGDVLEFLKKSDIKMPKPDDRDLFKILNKFSIRHHSTEQKGNYTHDVWYEFKFYLFLASVYVLLKLENLGE
jgi:hypothetical protein